MNPRIKSILAPFASMRLTVVLLILSIPLIFAGTLAQRFEGAYAIQHDYFYTLFAWVNPKIFLTQKLIDSTGGLGRFSIPIPGGYLLGLLLLLNLFAAHLVRFKLTLRRLGIIMIHAGIAILLLGQGLTSRLANEGIMTIQEGQKINYVEDLRNFELVVTTPDHDNQDNVTSIPASSKLQGSQINVAPLTIRVNQYFPNASVEEADLSDGRKIFTAASVPQSNGVDAAATDAPAANVSIFNGAANLANLTLSTVLDPQSISLNGINYQIALRNLRVYKPYTIELEKFHFDRYVGTDMDRNFASDVRVYDQSGKLVRDTVISMNNPLRYNGEVFYQQNFNHQTERGTVLQVVVNPARWFPYLACIVTALGLFYHFGWSLAEFLRKKSKAPPAPARATSVPPPLPQIKIFDLNALIPTTIAAIAVCSLLWIAKPPPPAPAHTPDFNSFGALPVNWQGRVQPLDSLARNSLRLISARDTVDINNNGSTNSATEWLLDVMAAHQDILSRLQNPSPATPPYSPALDARVFRIDTPDLVGLLKLDPNRSPALYSFNELSPHLDEFLKQADDFSKIDASARESYQARVIELSDHVALFAQLSDYSNLLLVPKDAQSDWQTPAQVFKDTAGAASADPQVLDRQMFRARPAMAIEEYAQGRVDTFNQLVAAQRQTSAQVLPNLTRLVNFETFFNRFAPFYQCMILCVVAIILASFSWLISREPLARSALAIMIVVLIVYTFGIVSRVLIQGLGPVTNLYASAVLIGWAVILFSLFLEIVVFKNAMPTALAAALAFCALYVAHGLSIDEGDTMKPVRAVLATNFWLATHVPTVTLGYAATFLAGFLALVYVAMGVFSEALDKESSKRITRAIYGVVCFATMLSFIGTVLGGIWADQSWGRFWGWDPKENGAVLIVLWNAAILHARWAGLVRERGIANMAIFGNVVTSWSWFGVNMLGVGLHSYGFMEAALVKLIIFDASQIMMIGIGLLPLSYWQSFKIKFPPPDSMPLPPAPVEQIAAR